jgi:hypothetical protein
MAKICVNERACIDLMQIGEGYIASIWLYGTQHHVGPYPNHDATISAVQQYINDLRLVAEIKNLQHADLSCLQACLSKLSELH